MSSKSPPNFGTVQTWPAHSVKEKVLNYGGFGKKIFFWKYFCEFTLLDQNNKTNCHKTEHVLVYSGLVYI